MRFGEKVGFLSFLVCVIYVCVLISFLSVWLAHVSVEDGLFAFTCLSF